MIIPAVLYAFICSVLIAVLLILNKARKETDYEDSKKNIQALYVNSGHSRSLLLSTLYNVVTPFHLKLNMGKELKTQIVKSSVLETVEKQSTPLIRKIVGITISTKEQYEMVAANIAKLKEYRKQAENELDGIINPLKLSTKNAQALFKPFFTQVNESEAVGKAAMLEWINKNQLKAAKVEEDFDNGKIKRISTVTSKTSELRDTSSESASVKKLWRLTIKDDKKIPREFLVPDEQAIREAFKRGEKVAGCEWKQENTIAI